MIILLSPAKTLDYETPLPPFEAPPADSPAGRSPGFLNDSAELADLLRQRSAEDLMALMDISPDLARLNVDRFQRWRLPLPAAESRPALFAFKGDVYEGLDATTLSPEDIAFADQHLRILSGLYGLLRPLDAMLPYRLEMGVKLANARGASLYRFWGDTQTRQINRDLDHLAEGDAAGHPRVVLNLASNEYFKAVQPRQLTARVVTPAFLDRKGAGYKMVSFYAKRARGLMARFVIRERMVDPENLVAFNLEGYTFNPALSEPDAPVFTREQPV